MKVYESGRIRNVTLAGHAATGKTSLASCLLYRAGAVGHLGKIQEKNTVTDFDDEEKERAHSLSTSLACAEWKDLKINLLDTPGTSSFIPDARPAMRVSDAAFIIVSAVEGVQVQTESVWDWALENDLPVAFVVNLMDRERADFDRVLEQLHEVFGKKVTAIAAPVGKGEGFRGYMGLLSGKIYEGGEGESGKMKVTEFPAHVQDGVQLLRRELVEKVAELDEALMEKYLEKDTLSPEELRGGFRKAFVTREVFPVLCASAARNIGSEAMLDFIAEFVPAPADRYPVKAKNREGQDIEVKAGSPPSAYVFKTLVDTYAGKISVFKVISGEVKPDISLVNTAKGEKEKLGPPFLLQGKEHFNVPVVHAGDIAAVAKLRDTGTGDTLADPGFSVVYPPVPFPDPILSFAVEPRSRADEDKISTTLHRLCEADPSLHFGRDPQTAELILSGNGQMHIEVAIARMKRLANLEIILHPPKVPYRETIKRVSEARYRHKKQTGGRGQFAECAIRLEPLSRGKDFEFENEVFGGAIPQSFIPAVEKGVQEARRKGFLANYPVVDFKCVVVDGKYHDVDSSEMAFKIASSRAFKEAMQKASAVLLEPVMNIQIVVPEECVGDIMGDLNSRRARVQGMDARGHNQAVKAQAPMSEMLNYAAALKSITADRGFFHMEFSHYDEVPHNVAEKVIAAAAKLKKEEEEE